MGLKNILKTIALATGIATAPAASQTVLHSPHDGSEYHHTSGRGYIAAGNVALGAALGGLGALVNGKPIGPALRNGAIGGLFQYTAKDLVGRNIALSWPAKAINAVGTAFVTNGALGKPVLSDIGMDIGPLYLRLTSENGTVRLRPYVLPDAVLSTALSITSGDQFQLEESLRAGTPVFRANRVWKNKEGNAFGNVVRYEKNLQVADWEKTVCKPNPASTSSTCAVFYDVGHLNTTRRHEAIHALQYSAGAQFTPLFGNLRNTLERTADRTGLWLLHGTGFASQWAPQIALPYEKRPFEIEAHGLAKYRRISRPLETYELP